MIVALLLGRKGSCGFPDKNLYIVNGRPLCFYPMKTALDAIQVNKVYLSTDDSRLIDIAKENNVDIIERPSYLCTERAMAEDAYVHGCEEISNRNGIRPEIVVLLFCNSVFCLPSTIDKGIDILKNDEEIDSAITVSKYNMWSPLRARKINEKGLLEPFISFDKFDNLDKLSCDRDSQGDVWFADFGACIVRYRCIENIKNGLLPQKWMGRKIYPLKQEQGLDVDFEWQIPQVEYWINNNYMER